MLTHANGGPRPAMGNLESVDYKGMRALKSYHSEFHHITGAALFFLSHSFIYFCISGYRQPGSNPNHRCQYHDKGHCPESIGHGSDSNLL